MARNEEKAQSMLHRYLRSRAGEGQEGQLGRTSNQRRRPYLATLCEDVDEARAWYKQVMQETNRKISEIQNQDLGQQRTRELNDEINKLIREGRHWKRRIRDLGGRDFASSEHNAITDCAISHKGYYYFGAAKELPGVASLLRQKKERNSDVVDILSRATPEELMRRINPDLYFGFQDTNLEAMEKQWEDNGRRKDAELWKEQDLDAIDIMWNTEWMDLVGRPPPNGNELEKALDLIALERGKLELFDELKYDARNTDH